MRLGDATWPDVERAAQPDADTDSLPGPIVVVPVGSTEQHGPHLPLATDSLIAEELAERVLHRTEGLMLAPTLTITSSGEHGGFPGTLSIGATAAMTVFIELARSADWAAGVVFVNGHGGNHASLARAVTTLNSEGRHALAWAPRWPRRSDGGPADLHAGRIETSLMLAIDPGLVRLELATPGPHTTIEALREHGVKAVSPSGVLGDPEGASGREGERLINAFVDDLLLAIERWRPLGAAGD